MTYENTAYIDEELSQSLKRLEEKGHLENTVTFLYSDHGDHMNYLLWMATKSGATDRMNPFMMSLIPSSLDEKIHENLRGN